MVTLFGVMSKGGCQSLETFCVLVMEQFYTSPNYVVKALVHHVDTAVVGVRIPSPAKGKNAHWADPCTEGAPIVRQDLSGRPTM